MHELSIAQSLVDMTFDRLAGYRNVSVLSIRIRVGALSCVHPDALECCYRMIVEGTSLQETKLEIEQIPVSIYCAICRTVENIPDIQPMICPRCQTPSADIRSGHELDLDSFVVENEE